MKIPAWPPHTAEALRRIEAKARWSSGRVFSLIETIRQSSDCYVWMLPAATTRVDLGFYGDDAEVLLVGRGSKVPWNVPIHGAYSNICIGRTCEAEIDAIDRLAPRAGLMEWLAPRFNPVLQPNVTEESPIPETEVEAMVQLLRFAHSEEEREAVRLYRLGLYEPLKSAILDCGLTLQRYEPKGSTVNRPEHFAVNSDLDVRLDVELPAGFTTTSRWQVLSLLLDAVIRTRFLEEHGVLPNFNFHD